MDISPSGQKTLPEPRHTGEKFLILWVTYPYPTLILMMDSYNLLKFKNEETENQKLLELDMF